MESLLNTKDVPVFVQSCCTVSLVSALSLKCSIRPVTASAALRRPPLPARNSILNIPGVTVDFLLDTPKKSYVMLSPLIDNPSLIILNPDGRAFSASG